MSVKTETRHENRLIMRIVVKQNRASRTDAEVCIHRRISRRAGQRLVLHIRNVLVRLWVAVSARQDMESMSEMPETWECDDGFQKQWWTQRVAKKEQKLHGSWCHICRKTKRQNIDIVRENMRTFWQVRNRWGSTWRRACRRQSGNYPVWCRDEWNSYCAGTRDETAVSNEPTKSEKYEKWEIRYLKGLNIMKWNMSRREHSRRTQIMEYPYSTQ